MPMIGQSGAASLFFLILGAAGVSLGGDLDIGTAGEMGVGYVPRALSIGCIGVGLWLGVPPILRRDPRRPLALAARPTLIVTALVLGFAAALPWIGLPLTVIAIVRTAAAAGEAFDPWYLLATAVSLAVLATLLFHTLLRLQVPVWPLFMGG